MSEVFILYMYRMFWALFLGALLAMGFRRSWNAEHGKMTDVYKRQGWKSSGL